MSPFSTLPSLDTFSAYLFFVSSKALSISSLDTVADSFLTPSFLYLPNLTSGLVVNVNINSNNDELLYHAIGFLVYSNNNFKEEDILYDNKVSVVNEIYGYFSENKNEINKELIKEISLKFEKLYEFKNYKKISEYLKKINKELSKEEIYKIILEPKKLEKINKEIEEFERNKFGEGIESV